MSSGNSISILFSLLLPPFDALVELFLMAMTRA